LKQKKKKQTKRIKTVIDKLYVRWNQIIAGITFLLALIVYLLTVAPTVSFWDCGEFIATAYTLGVPHPPGSPLFLIIGRIFSMLPIGTDIAYRINLISPLVSAAAVFLLYLIIVKVVAHWRGAVSSKQDAVIAFGGAFIGALVFAYSDSHWFNAVEAEVYSISTFFTAIVVWLILHWAERAETPGNERYILIIAYMIGLAIGVHLLNLLALPFVALIVYFKKQEFEWKSFLVLMGFTALTFFIIHNGIIKGLPRLAEMIGVWGVVGTVIVVFGIMIWAILEKQRLLSIVFTSMVLILVGYSSYSIIFIRSNQDPTIDENNPETVSAAISYLEREQYGQVGQFPRRYDGLPAKHKAVGYPNVDGEYTSTQDRSYKLFNPTKQWSYFLNYQVKKMYWRYFLWQFAGRGPSTEPGVTNFGANPKEDGVDWSQFGLPLAFFLGFGGMLYHFNRDKKEAFSIFTLFFFTGLAIVLYLNQDNPQPRERDYSYVGSFFAFSVWVGVGASAVFETIYQKIKDKDLAHRLATVALTVLTLLVPLVMLQANYHEHNRSGNYVAWDMSYNMLQSCEPNSIIFTNGDNDTFPLWYLQEVEGVRKDVTVANLSLLNTPWYIKQLRDSRPKGKRFIRMTDDKINEWSAGLIPWEAQAIRIPAENDPLNTKGYIEWTVKPTYGGALKVQDMMILKILNDSKWEYPIYFAVTVSPSNRVGLDDFISMEGLTFKVHSHKVNMIDHEKMDLYLMTELKTKTWSDEFTPESEIPFISDLEQTYWSKQYQPGYLFRNLGNDEVYFNQQIVRLLQNYRSAYWQLAVHYFLEFQREGRKSSPNQEYREEMRTKALAVLNQMSKNIPEKTIYLESRELYYQIGMLYGQLGNKKRFETVLNELSARKNLSIDELIRYGQTYIQELDNYDKARKIFETLYSSYLKQEELIKKQGLSKSGMTSQSWNTWKKSFTEIVSSLVLIYKEMELEEPYRKVLTEWIERNPEDNQAKRMLSELDNKPDKEIE